MRFTLLYTEIILILSKCLSNLNGICAPCFSTVKQQIVLSHVRAKSVATDQTPSGSVDLKREEVQAGGSSTKLKDSASARPRYVFL